MFILRADGAAYVRAGVPLSLERNEESVLDAPYPSAAADHVAHPLGVCNQSRGRSLQLRRGLALCVSLANENDDVISLLSEDEAECVRDASNEILEGLAARSRMRHLNTPPTLGAGAPSLPLQSRF
jgi:hypothetical protein